MADDPVPVPEPADPATGDAEERRIRDRIADARLKAEELRTEAQVRLEEERGRRTWVEIVYRAWDMDRQRGGPLLAGGLAYRVFIWILPFALLLAAIVELIADSTGRSPEELARTVGIGGAIVGVVGEAARATGSSAWWLLFLGLVLSLWAARGLARALMVVSRIAWALPPSAGRATVKAALVVWGLFFAGLAVQWLRPLLFRGGVRSDLLAQIVLFGLTLAVIAGGMTLAPRRGPWTSVIAGAILMAVGLRGMGIATNVYFVDALGEKGELYGGLGLAIVIMLFLFLCSRLFVWGQFLNARIGGVRMADPMPVQVPDASLDEAEEGSDGGG